MSKLITLTLAVADVVPLGPTQLSVYVVESVGAELGLHEVAVPIFTVEEFPLASVAVIVQEVILEQLMAIVTC